jgi:hypothetical protein
MNGERGEHEGERNESSNPRLAGHVGSFGMTPVTNPA